MRLALYPAAGRRSQRFGFARDATAAPIGDGQVAFAAQAAEARDTVHDAPAQAGFRHQALDCLACAGRQRGCLFLDGAQVLPKLFRLVQSLRRQGAECRVVFGERERSAACLQGFPIAFEKRGDGGLGPAARRNEQRAGGEADQVVGVGQAPCLVEIVDAPDQAALGIPPGAEVLDMEVTDREDHRRPGCLGADIGPHLGPAIVGSAQKGERRGTHLLMFQHQVRTQQAKVPREPLLVFGGGPIDLQSRHTPGVSIHFSRPSGFGSETLAVDPHESGLFHIHVQRRTIQQEGRQWNS